MSTTDIAGAAAAAEVAPLSLNQEFVSLFDQGSEDGPFGPRYHVVAGWRVTGAPVRLDALRGALLDVVERHEALRTRIAGPPGHRHQEILPPSPVRMDVRDLSPVPEASRAGRAEALTQEIEAETISPDEAPFLRAVLARFDDRDAVLVLMTHHLAADGLSMGVIVRDLANRYAARTGHTTSKLPAAPQYREYGRWQREGAGTATDAAREYWRRQLDGALFTAIPTDIPRSAGLPESTAKYQFLIPGDVVSAIDRVAQANRTTRFMAIAAMYQLLAHRLTGATDVVIATFTPGRGGELYGESVGSFFNFVPLRTNLAGCTTYEELLKRTRRTCLGAFLHDIPSIQIFAEAPELMRPAMTDDATAVVLESVPDPKQIVEAPGDLTYARIPRPLGSQLQASSVPDGALWDLGTNPSGEAIGLISYKRNLFREDTIAGMAAEFGQIARAFAFSPDASPGVA
jgi:condensation enzyme